MKTGSTDFNNEDSNFYIIANSGDALTSTDGGALKTTGIGFSDITTEPGILVYGPKPYTKTTGSTKPVEFLAKLCRAYAYVTVNYTPAKGITIASAAIENVPDKIYPHTGRGASGYDLSGCDTHNRLVGHPLRQFLFLPAREPERQRDGYDRTG